MKLNPLLKYLRRQNDQQDELFIKKFLQNITLTPQKFHPSSFPVIIF